MWLVRGLAERLSRRRKRADARQQCDYWETAVTETFAMLERTTEPLARMNVLRRLSRQLTQYAGVLLEAFGEDARLRATAVRADAWFAVVIADLEHARGAGTVRRRAPWRLL